MSRLARFAFNGVSRVKCNNPVSYRFLCSTQVPSSGSAAPASASGAPSPESSWSWIPPRASASAEARVDDELIPVIPGELLTGEEIRLALEQQGGEDVRVMDVKGRLDTIRTFVIASGRSSRHLRKMGDSVVSALKARGLRQAPGFTGIEGDKEDDWMLVDCYNIAVNLMLPATRTALNIEDHWSREEKPSVAFTGDSKEYDARFEELLEQFPVPEAYSRSREDGAGTAEEAGLGLDEAHARLADDGVILEPFAMKSILKQARAGTRRGRGVVGGGGAGVAKPQQGRIRRKSVTKNMK